MVLAVVVVSILFLLGSSMIALGSTGKKMSLQQRDMIQAYYIAEAGVERVLARAKADIAWVQGLPSSSALPAEDFGGGRITGIIIDKQVNGSVITLTVTSSGKYNSSSRTVKVTADINIPSGGADLSEGLWLVGDVPSLFHNNVKINSPIISNGPLDFDNNIEVNGTVKAGGSVTFNNNAINGDLFSKGSISGGNNATVGNITALGSVSLDNNSEVQGSIRAGGSISTGNIDVTGDVLSLGAVSLSHAVVGGSVKANGAMTLFQSEAGAVDAVGSMSLTQTEISGDCRSTSAIILAQKSEIGKNLYIKELDKLDIDHNSQVKGQVIDNPSLNVSFNLDLGFNIPFVPQIDAKYYQDNASVTYQEDQIINLTPETPVEGIHYIEGNVSIDGTYSGTGIIFATGTATVGANLQPENNQSALTVISLDEMTLRGEVWGVFYSSRQVTVQEYKGLSDVRGSITCRNIVMKNNTTFTYDEQFINRIPNNDRVTMTIKSWTEQYPIF